MRVSVKLVGPLRMYYRSGPSTRWETVDLADGASIADLMADYGIPGEKVHLFHVNRRKADPHRLLADGDRVWLIPLAAGG